MSTTLRDHIQKDLIARIAAGSLDSDGLTLSRLAKDYGVSLTPVRQAVSVLLEKGLLSKKSNGRLAPSAKLQGANGGQQRRRNRRPVLPSSTSSADKLLNDLLREIVAHAVGDQISYLREEATAKRNGVGRTAIRQALSQLAGRGLVEHIPRCGWRVRRLDEGDMRSYLAVREVLELKALELAEPHLVPADLERMLRGNLPELGRQRLDNNLHGYLIAKADNAYIADFFKQHGAYYNMLFDFAAPEVRMVKQMAAQHREILKSLIARDWKGARHALATHIQAQQPILIELLRQLNPNDSSSTAQVSR